MKLTLDSKKTAINKLKQMVKFDQEDEVRYLYQNSKEFMSAREFLRLRLQEIINRA